MVSVGAVKFIPCSKLAYLDILYSQNDTSVASQNDYVNGVATRLLPFGVGVL